MTAYQQTDTRWWAWLALTIATYGRGRCPTGLNVVRHGALYSIATPPPLTVYRKSGKRHWNPVLKATSTYIQELRNVS